VIVIVGALTAAWVSDALPGSARWPIMAFASTMGIIFPTALAATPVHPTHRAQRWVLYYLAATMNVAAGVCWTFVNETSRHDPEKRAYVGAMMNAFAYIFTAWVPIFTFPTYKQPFIVTGNYVNAGFAAAALVLSVLIGYLHNRDVKRKAAQKQPSLRDEETSSGEQEKL
jgi:ACS family pantothenate transporter-like MFS transporter